MSTQKSLFLLEKQGKYAVSDAEIPSPGPRELLIEVKAVGLNPVDWKVQTIGYIIDDYPAVLGSDAAGVVKAVGEGVTGFAVGDNV
jgi:NADPH:quinone reductase-like Zn-dependent oxidoreductase